MPRAMCGAVAGARGFGAFVFFGALACTAAVGEPGESLVDSARWRLVSANEDPYADRPLDDACPSWSYGLEGAAFEVRTDGCRYGTFVQESARAVHGGEVLRITIEHLGLFSPVPAEAHLAVSIDAEVVWETHIPIPSEAALRVFEARAPARFAAGVPIHFHIHNHGSNSWRLLDIEVVP